MKITSETPMPNVCTCNHLESDHMAGGYWNHHEPCKVEQCPCEDFDIYTPGKPMQIVPKRPYVTGKARTHVDPLELLKYHTSGLDEMGQITLGALQRILDGYMALKQQSDEQVVGLVTVSNNLGQLIAAVRLIDQVGQMNSREAQEAGLPSYADTIHMAIGIANLLANGAE